MKKLFSILSLAALLAVSAPAQVPTSDYQSFSLPGTIAANVTSNLTAAQQVTIGGIKQQNVAIEWTFNTSVATPLTNYALIFQRSVTGTYYDTNNVITVPITGSNGALTNVCSTNINTAGFGYLKLVAIVNGSASATLTNLTGAYSVKMSAP